MYAKKFAGLAALLVLALVAVPEARAMSIAHHGAYQATYFQGHGDERRPYWQQAYWKTQADWRALIHRAHGKSDRKGYGRGDHKGYDSDRKGYGRGDHKGNDWGRHSEGWIAFLKAELKITEEQLPRWETFADSLRANTAMWQKRREEKKAARKAAAEEGKEKKRESKSVVERLERRIAFGELLLQTGKSLHAAFKPLYEEMTEDQKQQADMLLRRRFWR